MHIILAISVTCGLIFNFFMLIKERGDDSVKKAAWKYFSYYTNLTNILVGIWIYALIFSPSSTLGILASNANVSAAITFYIFSVGIANYALTGLEPHTFANRIADLLVHAITPILTVIYWIELSDKTGLSFHLIPLWLIYLLSYALYTITHGYWSEFYPYSFTNMQELGLKRVGYRTLGLSLSVLVGATLFILIGKSLS
jgi:hypothetical protein